jgi:16S rRNA processing protein RimM
MQQGKNDLIRIGRITGLYGVKGWVKIYSYTEPRDNVISYFPWQVFLKGEWRTLKVEEGRTHGKGVVAKLEGYDDRDAAATLMDADIAIDRSQLPPAEDGEYYWIDLVDLNVVNAEGVELGKVVRVMPTGANDVLVVQGDQPDEILIPFVQEVFILNVDLENKLITVDWQLDE